MLKHAYQGLSIPVFKGFTLSDYNYFRMTVIRYFNGTGVSAMDFASVASDDSDPWPPTDWEERNVSSEGSNKAVFSNLLRQSVENSKKLFQTVDPDTHAKFTEQFDAHTKKKQRIEGEKGSGAGSVVDVDDSEDKGEDEGDEGGSGEEEEEDKRSVSI